MKYHHSSSSSFFYFLLLLSCAAAAVEAYDDQVAAAGAEHDVAGAQLLLLLNGSSISSSYAEKRHELELQVVSAADWALPSETARRLLVDPPSYLAYHVTKYNGDQPGYPGGPAKGPGQSATNRNGGIFCDSRDHPHCPNT